MIIPLDPVYFSSTEVLLGALCMHKTESIKNKLFSLLWKSLQSTRSGAREDVRHWQIGEVVWESRKRAETALEHSLHIDDFSDLYILKMDT